MYEGTLSYGMPDRLFLSKEKVTYKRTAEVYQRILYNGNLVESGLLKIAIHLQKFCKDTFTNQSIPTDTSDTAKIKMKGYVRGLRVLRSDAGTLLLCLNR